MSTEHQDQLAERPRPNTLARERSTRMTEMLRRVVPEAVGEDGVSHLDVCAFNSSIG